jgi:peptide/nickel transport system permease protein
MKLYRTQWIGLSILTILLAFVLIEKLWFKGDIARQQLELTFAEPNWHDILGTDHYGRSNAARLADAIMNSLLMAGLCVTTASLLGTISGVWAGWQKVGSIVFFRCW